MNLFEEIIARSNGWSHIGDCPLNPCTCGIEAFIDNLETEAKLRLAPKYNVTTRMNDKSLSVMEPIEDPFINTTVTISWKDLIKSLFTKGGMKINVVVAGNRDAHFKFFRGDRIGTSGRVQTY